jgi:hypothetical protein
VIPLRKENESNEAMRARLKTESLLFINKFSDKQAKPLITIVLTLLMLGIISFNIKYQILRNNYLTEYFLGILLTCFQNKNKIYSFF